MLDTLSHPIWLRDRNGRITWVNEPFVFAVDAESVADVIIKQIEFLDPSSLKQASALLELDEVFNARIPVIVSGQRRIYDIVETPLAAGTIGYASDVSDLESTRHDMENQMASHVRTLDQLPTAVAIFDEKQRLQFCNLAYRKLWQFDEEFTLSCPTDSEILDRLRDLRRLPEQADYKSWKKNLHAAYLTLETREMAWYLPGSRTLRVVVNPNPQGGVTYLFEDVTAQFALQSNFNALSRVQSETLDSLKEGVAVFGMDGRLKLNNPAFETIWSLEPKRLSNQPHIDEIILAAFNLYAEANVWSAIKGAIAGFSDARHGQFYRMDRYDGSTIDCALAPLPDGATLVTFVDVSASVQIERALKERNEALEQAGQLRENFVHHVSYQLRSPLTNVIGFTELLASGVAGPLTDRQSEYIGHVFQSSNALMAIIDDILDLASFDRGEVVLERTSANIRDVVATAAEGLQDRIRERNINLILNVDESVDTFLIDIKRVRHILFNLLSNAIGFSSEGQSVVVSVAQSELGLSISVQDTGRGIPADVIDRVFQRFETYSFGSRHRGAGLGLSIVRALVELHGGTVQIESEPGQGTTVTCIFTDDHAKTATIEAA
jgi:signal transduction histidine kinase